VQVQPRGREGGGARASVGQSCREVRVTCQGGCKLLTVELRVYHKHVCRVLRIIPARTVRVDPEGKIASRGKNTRRWIVLCYGEPGVLPALVGCAASSRGLLERIGKAGKAARRGGPSRGREEAGSGRRLIGRAVCVREVDNQEGWRARGERGGCCSPGRSAVPERKMSTVRSCPLLVWNLLRILLPLIGKRRAGKVTSRASPTARQRRGRAPGVR